MWYHYIAIKNGKKRIIWSALFVFVATAFSVVIGSAEAFWYLLTGGFSPLIGLYALVIATLLVIRVVGASLVGPIVAVDPVADPPCEAF
jgi:hypothetical protein